MDHHVGDRHVGAGTNPAGWGVLPPAPGPSGAVDLAALAARVRAGDDAALERFVATLEGPVRRLLAVRLSGQPGDVVADCTQEALARIAARARTSQGPRPSAGGSGVGEADGAGDGGRVLSWAFAVAHHAALNHLRSGASGAALHARTVPLSELTSVATRRGTGALWPHLVSDVAWADDADELPPARRALCQIAVRAQAALSPDGAELVWGRVIAGASWEELARQFGTTATAVKRRFQRAQATLRAACLAAVDALPATDRAAARAHLGLTAAAAP